MCQLRKKVNRGEVRHCPKGVKHESWLLDPGTVSRKFCTPKGCTPKKVQDKEKIESQKLCCDGFASHFVTSSSKPRFGRMPQAGAKSLNSMLGDVEAVNALHDFMKQFQPLSLERLFTKKQQLGQGWFFGSRSGVLQIYVWGGYVNSLQ